MDFLLGLLSLDVLAQAYHHQPLIFSAMIVSFVTFFLVFIWALCKKENNHSSSSIFRFAPSVMTALGLLGTFYGLTESLGELNISNAESVNSIEPFINSLKPVFSFSIIGIGASIVFMLCNALLMAVNQYRARTIRDKNKDDIQAHRSYSKKVNSATLEQLQKSNHHLSALDGINKLIGQQNTFLSKSYRYRDEKINKQVQSLQNIDETTKSQQSLFVDLGQQMSLMSSAISNMQTGFDSEQLATLMGEKIKEALNEPLTSIANALQQNNKTVIEGLLQELKTELLIPIKDEITQNTSNINNVTKALEDAQDTNAKMITAINTTTDTINGVVSSNKEAVDTMQSIVKDIQVMQGKQEQALNKFNAELNDNLKAIEPAIKQGMKDATDNMNDVLKTATDNMNQTLGKTQEALGDIVGEITKNVLVKISEVLGDFNTNMDTHIGRMNNELERTGQRAQRLMDTSASNLEKTLGEIDSTLQGSSEKLQSELQAFRDQYNLSLTKFFNKQNEQLEKTLGVQNEQLQKTADQLNKQFDKMKEAQEKLNNETIKTINHANGVYGPLLSSATTIATNLNMGQKTLVKDLQAMQEHTDNINNALKDLGNTMPKEFGKAFKTLNDTYIERFNSTTEMLQTAMKEMVTAAAALLSTSRLNKDED